MKIAVSLALLAVCGSLHAAEFQRDAIALRPAHTFSIVAMDAATGQLGAAVQSHWFSVGANVIWAEPGVGAVATQSFIEVSYGPNGLALMRDGSIASDRSEEHTSELQSPC